MRKLLEVSTAKSKDELQQYNPIKGLEAIATAEVGEKYFERAKDVTGLYHAVETKLSEQRKFVLWWDAQGLKGGDRRSEEFQSNGAVTLKPGENGVPDKMVIHRWRIRLKDEKNFEAACNAAQERCRRVCEAEKGSTEQKGASGTGENEWYTPKKYIQLARDVLQEIDLDPATSEAAQDNIKAIKYFTKLEDGLRQSWHGRVWLNPPYAQPFIAEFISKLVAEVRAGHTSEAIMLTHNYTDTAWFHEAAKAATGICFTRGRVRFVDSKGFEASPTQGQAFFYFGASPLKFAEIFLDVGFVVSPVKFDA